MADRQDIDALMMGALYGELDSAESQRLEAHLASHPQDRAALDAMTQTRGRVRDGLAAVPATELSPGISALLLQEAARRASTHKKASGGSAGSGLWAWLHGALRPMIAHPALAAAAAFVLFVGVAGSFLLRGPRGGMYEASAPPREAEPRLAALEQRAEPAPAPAVPTAPQPAEGLSYQAQLSENAVGDRAVVAAAPPSPPRTETRSRAADKAPAKAAKAAKDALARAQLARKPEAVAARVDEAGAVPADDAEPEAEVAGSAEADKRRYVPVTTPEPALKSDEDLAEGSVSLRAAQTAPAAVPEAAPPAPAAAPAPSRPSGSAGAAAAAPYDAARERGRDEWARVKHGELRNTVKRRDCASAATLAREIAARAREYYAASVADDKALRPCKAAIDLARKKDAERRRKAPEPAATSAD